MSSFLVIYFFDTWPKTMWGTRNCEIFRNKCCLSSVFCTPGLQYRGETSCLKKWQDFLLCCSEINIMYIHRPCSVLIKCCSSSLLCSKSLLYYQEIFTSSLLWLAGNCFLTWSHAPQFPAQCTLAPPCQFWKITQLFFEKWTPMVRKTHTNWQKITYLFAEKHTPNVL